MCLCVCVCVWIRLQRTLGVCVYMFVCKRVSERQKKTKKNKKKSNNSFESNLVFGAYFSSSLRHTIQTKQIPLSFAYGRLRLAGTFLGISDSKERSRS